MKSIIFKIAAAAMILTACSTKVDVLVVGGGASGTAAGIQAARLGARTIVAEEHQWLGGMLTSAGVSAVDGNYKMQSGIFGEFVDSLNAYYQSPLNTGWVSNTLFEPHVGDRIFKNMAAAYDNLGVLYNTTFVKAEKCGTGWKVTLTTNGGKLVVKTSVLIDGTELGDVAKACGVPYEIGMESKTVTGESIAPDEANDIIQDLTMCMTLKDYGPDADMTIAKPTPYDPTIYYNCAVNPHNHDFEDAGDGKIRKADTKQSIWPAETMLTYGKLPVKDGHSKYMINWPVDANDVYVNFIDATPERRQQAIDSCKNITLGFLYFLQTELGYKNLGLADDEFPTQDGLPFIPYYRESRRTDGLVRLKLDDVADPYRNTLYRTGIGSGDYPVDHHHYRNKDWMKLPRLYFYPIPSYNIPLGIMIPQATQNLIVAEKSVSVSNLVNGTTRLQPVVLQIGQAAGALAALSLKYGDIKEVPVRKLQDTLLAAGVYIMPYMDLDNDDPMFAAIQRVGATGIMRGDGKPVGWENETWFRVDDPLTPDEVYLDELYPGKTWEDLGLPAYDPENPITRGEMAVLIDQRLDPFHSFPVDVEGRIVVK